MRTTLLLILAAAFMAPIGCRRTTYVERPVVSPAPTVIERQPTTVIERQPTTVIERQPTVIHEHRDVPDTTVIDRRPGSTTVIERR